MLARSNRKVISRGISKNLGETDEEESESGFIHSEKNLLVIHISVILYNMI